MLERIEAERIHPQEIALKLLTVNEVALILQIPKATLYKWRSEGQGPPSCKIGKHVRYPARGLTGWVDARVKVG